MTSASCALCTILLFTEFSCSFSDGMFAPGTPLNLPGRGSPSRGSKSWHPVASVNRSLRKAITDPFKHWPDGVIPYELDPRGEFSFQEEMVLEAAMSMWSADTCLRFRPKTPTDENYVTFTGGDYCWSYIGRKGGQQFVILNKQWCRDLRTVMHEIGHAIGLHHEQNRPDRDEYVKILWKNIDDDKEYNFEKAQDVDTYNAPYDLSSIMHYRNNEFSQGRGKSTIKSLKGSGDKMGQIEELSFYDVRTVSLMYKCYAPCGVTIPSLACRDGTAGFLGKDCNCYYLETFVSHILHD